MAGGGVRKLDRAMWRALLEAEYHNIPKGQCPTCINGRSQCGRFFCVQCRVGGVCEANFLAGGEHALHPKIQVRQLSRELSVCVDDVEDYMPEAMVNQIQQYSAQHTRAVCKFKRKEDGAQQHGLRICRRCNRSISRCKKYPNNSASPVCSLTCLLEYHAQAQQPAQRPAQQPAQLSAQQPAQHPAQQPAQLPAQGPAKGPAQGPAQLPAQWLAQRPALWRGPALCHAQRPAHQPA